MLYIGLWNIMGEKRISILPPTIMKPKPLWTGKQLISNIIQNIVGLKGKDVVGLNLEGKTRLQGDYLGPFGKEET